MYSLYQVSFSGGETAGCWRQICWKGGTAPLRPPSCRVVMVCYVVKLTSFLYNCRRTKLSVFEMQVLWDVTQSLLIITDVSKDGSTRIFGDKQHSSCTARFWRWRSVATHQTTRHNKPKQQHSVRTYIHAIFNSPPSQFCSQGTEFTSWYRFVPGEEAHGKYSRA
jgi:hypothetical protein